MSEKEKPLPKPPSTPFGRKRRYEEGDEKVPLMADQLAEAMAAGRLEEFFEREMPESEYARTLATMMLGMTGMLPPEGSPPVPEKKREKNTEASGEKDSSQEMSATVQPPEDMVTAILTGDVKGLMGLLEREHKKRIPDREPNIAEKRISHTDGRPTIDKAVIDRLIKIASENNLTLDWIILRALKVYVEEHEKTGRL